MKFRHMLYALILSLQVVGAAFSTPHTNHLWHDLPTPDEMERKDIRFVLQSSDLVIGLDLWSREAARRYDKFVLLAVHGVSMNDNWYAVGDIPRRHVTPMPILISQVKKKFPGYRIVMIVCNPGNLSVDYPGVSYARKNVWVTPDSFVGIFTNTLRDIPVDGVGNIDEFIENPVKE